ncbi:MAG: allophanate hydrolase [Anaerolineae bacterium]|nr:MAG: allophanate hydrolase [Anaerolineae bacterium]
MPISHHVVKIIPLSDCALLVQLGESIDPLTNRQVHLLAAALERDPLPGFLECVPGYASLAVHYDPLILAYGQIYDWLVNRLALVEPSAARPARRVEVPVTYDGPDLEFVAAYCHLTPAQVIGLHSSTLYHVYMMGFAPGFAYLGIVPEPLRVPRLETPRTRVPAGSVAIAGAQTGIYPFETPGGWRLLGHTALTLFDPLRDPPFLFAPGDEVQFVPA